MDINKKVNQKLYKMRSQEVPGYFQPLSILAFIIIFIATLINIGMDNNKPAPTPSPTQYSIGSSSTTLPAEYTETTTYTDSTAPTTAASTPPPSSNTLTEVKFATQSGSMKVPTDAFNLANLVAKARVSGDTSGIEFAAGTPQIAPSGSLTDQAVVEIKIITYMDGNILFDSKVDPDGPGPQSTRYSSIRTGFQNGKWVYAGAN